MAVCLLGLRYSCVFGGRCSEFRLSQCAIHRVVEIYIMEVSVEYKNDYSALIRYFIINIGIRDVRLRYLYDVNTICGHLFDKF